jgi:hypothetical protein
MLLFTLLIVFGTTPAFSQSRTHNLGDLDFQIYDYDDLNTNDTDGLGIGTWPQGIFRYQTIAFYNTPFFVGSWTAEDGVHTNETIGWPFSFNNAEGYGIFEYKKHEPPEVWVFSEGKIQLSSRPFNGTVNANLPSDQMIELRYKAYPGFDVLKRTYSFSNENHDDYIIFYNRYLCTFDWDEDPEPDAPTDQTIQDMYIGYGYSPQTNEGTYITYSRWMEEAKDDWATYERHISTLAPGGRDLWISYGWDGDDPNLVEYEPGGGEFDDTGDPRFAIGDGGTSPLPSAEFVSHAYIGFAGLHADTSPNDNADDIAQPVSILTNVNIYNFWDADYPGYATGWHWAASGTKQSVEDQSGWPDDASSVEAEMPFQAYGPYNFALGDSLVIVYVLAANGISRDLAIEKGLEWRDWYRGVSGADFDNDAKNDLLATGRDSLFQTIDRAHWNWRNGMNLPSPPPAPDLTVTSGPLENYLEWEDLSEVGDPNTGTPDLDHYNIYRKKGAFWEDVYEELNSEGTHLRWEKITEVPSSQTEYTDTDVERGESYRYAVTAVDDGTQNTTGLFPGQPLESSRYANRTVVAAIPFAPGATNTDKVRIVPNPYIVGANDFNFTDDNRLLFVNLPPYCTLRIYTATGDLIKTIEHVSGSADEIWDQVTESTQFVASGVYILQVSNARDINNNDLPDVTEKFVIIR